MLFRTVVQVKSIEIPDFFETRTEIKKCKGCENAKYKITQWHLLQHYGLGYRKADKIYISFRKVNYARNKQYQCRYT